MTKAKPSVEQTQERLSSYKFDTANYIVLDSAVRRDTATGQLVPRQTKAKELKK